MQGNHLIVRAAIALTIAAAALASMPWGAGAQGIPRDLADKLTPAQLATYEVGPLGGCPQPSVRR